MTSILGNLNNSIDKFTCQEIDHGCAESVKNDSGSKRYKKRDAVSKTLVFYVFSIQRSEMLYRKGVFL